MHNVLMVFKVLLMFLITPFKFYYIFLHSLENKFPNSTSFNVVLNNQTLALLAF